MTNNEVLLSLQKIFDLNSPKVFQVYSLLDENITQAEVDSWFRKPSEKGFAEMEDLQMSTFLNALICERRGKKEGPQPQPEAKITNNIILKKLKIALSLKNEDIQEILKSVGVEINAYELTSYFRKPVHKNYRPIKNNTLKSFLKGLSLEGKK